MKYFFFSIVLIVFCGCSLNITRKSLSDTSWAYNESLLLYQNYTKAEDTYRIPDVLLHKISAFVPFRHKDFPYAEKSLFGFCEREDYSTLHFKVEGEFYDWLVNQKTVNRSANDSVNALNKGMSWEGNDEAIKYFKKYAEIFMIGKVENEASYLSYLLLVKYDFNTEEVAPLTFLMNDIVCVNSRNGVITSLIQVGFLMREQTSFQIGWTEKKGGGFLFKKYEGDSWIPYTPKEIEAMKVSGKWFKAELEYASYMIDNDGFLRPGEF